MYKKLFLLRFNYNKSLSFSKQNIYFIQNIGKKPSITQFINILTTFMITKLEYNLIENVSRANKEINVWRIIKMYMWPRNLNKILYRLTKKEVSFIIRIDKIYQNSCEDDILSNSR